MTKSLKESQKINANSKASLRKNAQLQQALAQLEAALLRKENQKVTEKSQKT